MSALFSCFAGLVVGAAQAGLLGRSTGRSAGYATRGSHFPGPLLRIGLVAGVLVAAALAGELPAAFAGWATGFLLASTAVYRRLP